MAPKLSAWKATWKDRIEDHKHKRFIEVELDFIRNNYSCLSRMEIAWVLGRTTSSVKAIIDKKLHVQKTKAQVQAICAKSTNSGRFKKGNEPANSHGSPGIVTVRQRIDRNEGAYQFIKMEDGKWLHLHRYIWELKHGPIPKGQMVIFKDGNSMHCTLENLQMISMKENALRNSGSINLPDSYVAGQLAKEGRQVNKKLKEEYLEHPELLELKREQIILNREIKSNDKRNHKNKA